MLVHLLGERGSWDPWRVLLAAPETSLPSAGMPMLTPPLGMPGGAGYALCGVMTGETLWAYWYLVRCTTVVFGARCCDALVNCVCRHCVSGVPAWQQGSE